MDRTTGYNPFIPEGKHHPLIGSDQPARSPKSTPPFLPKTQEVAIRLIKAVSKTLGNKGAAQALGQVLRVGWAADTVGKAITGELLRTGDTEKTRLKKMQSLAMGGCINRRDSIDDAAYTPQNRN